MYLCVCMLEGGGGSLALPTITYSVQCMVWGRGHEHTKLVLLHEILRRLVNGQIKPQLSFTLLK